jgi:hypothetical protein
METALLLWEACCIPSLLHGAGTWGDIKPATEKRLNALQQWFLRLVLQVGPGAPLASLGWETGVTDMKLRVWKEKVMLVRHLRSLGADTLASRVYREQVAMDWPGLARESQEICRQLGIEDCNNTNIAKAEYKNVVQDAITKKNEEILREQADGKTKCERIMIERYGKKPYISESLIVDVRNMYRTRVGMMPFAGNYSHDRRFAKTEWMCRCQETKEDERHLTSGECPVYNDILEKYENLKEDGDLVKYFMEVLERRDLIDEMDKEEEDEEETGPALAGGQHRRCTLAGDASPAS